MVRLPALPLPDRLKAALLAPAAFAIAALLSVLVAWGAAVLIERVSVAAVKTHLLTEGIAWAEVQADGLQIQLLGTAPNEAARYRAVNLAGAIVDSSRVRDKLEVVAAKPVEAPRFSVEMLRNDDGIQLIGLLPEGTDETRLTDTAQALSPAIALSNMIETAAYPAPAGWQDALDFGMQALQLLPRSKISVAADQVAVTAIATSEAEKRDLLAQLNRQRPEALQVSIEISAPRPVLTPFTLRFVKDAQGARFDACAADTDAARAKILAAAGAAGALGRLNCIIGLGVPTPSWADAAVAGLRAVGELGDATITFKDADVTLLAGADVAQADFDRVVGDLDASLPDVFSLNATLEKKSTSPAEGPAEFTATLPTESRRVEIRGRLTDDVLRAAVDSFARAQFGSGNVYLATLNDPTLPDGWPVRVLAGLEALGQLHHGSLLVRADTVEVRGVTGSQTGKARISQILSDKLGQGKTFKVDVTYDEALDPLAALPTPEECAQDVSDVLLRQKISFTPGSADLDPKAGSVMTALADVLKDCPGIKMEIGGHTDAQGSEEGNRALSQARAEAVLAALRDRDVDVSGMVAKGYGETVPIADNETEEGREANRRIEFTLEGAPKPAAFVPKASGAVVAAGADAATEPDLPLPEAEAIAEPARKGPRILNDTPASKVAPKDSALRPKKRPKKKN